MKILRASHSLRLSTSCALVVAAIFHITFTVIVFSIGRFSLFPTQFDREGFGEFARDSRMFNEQANALADLLQKREFEVWAKSPSLHVKLYSLNLTLTRPFLGSNILAIEPLNLICYLAIATLTFGLARLVGGTRTAWAAAAVVGLWPSLLLHTTQMVRDPLLIAAFLALVLVLIQSLQHVYNWRRALIAGLTAALACFLIWKCRRDIWLVIMAIVGFSTLLFTIRIIREKKLLGWNVGVIALLCALIFIVPRSTAVPAGIAAVNSRVVRWNRSTSVSGIIGEARGQVISENINKSGSIVDADVTLSGLGGVIKYVPRALEIGYLAPFPSMWFSAGYSVGLIGRLLAGMEMCVTYIIEALACIFVWRRWHHLDSWLLLVTTTIGSLALGLVVADIGALYRVRYPFWILMVVMAMRTVVNGWSL